MSHKSGVAIEVTYQAVGATTGLTDVQMDVYDEAHLIDAPKGGAMTEIGTTGRYYKTFTPDAEGEWTVMIDSATASGKIVKKFEVVGHSVDSVGDAIAALNNLAVGDLNNISTAQVATELSTYDAATGAEVAALNDVSTAQIATELETYDAVKKSELDALQGGSETLGTIKTAIDGLSALPMVG